MRIAVFSLLVALNYAQAIPGKIPLDLKYVFKDRDAFYLPMQCINNDEKKEKFWAALAGLKENGKAKVFPIVDAKKKFPDILKIYFGLPQNLLAYLKKIPWLKDVDPSYEIDNLILTDYDKRRIRFEVERLKATQKIGRYPDGTTLGVWMLVPEKEPQTVYNCKTYLPSQEENPFMGTVEENTKRMPAPWIPYTPSQPPSYDPFDPTRNTQREVPYNPWRNRP